MIDGSLLPGSIQFNSTKGNNTISVFENKYNLTNQFQVKVVVTDSLTGITSTSNIFKVTIKCTKSIDIALNSVKDINY